jgi:hypothetical protein
MAEKSTESDAKSTETSLREIKDVRDPFVHRTLTTIKLKGSNYLPWSRAVTVSLRASGETSYITDASSPNPK